MQIPLLILLPLVAGLVSFFIRSDVVRRGLYLTVAVAHTAAVVWIWVEPPPPLLEGWVALDDLGRLFLGISSLLFMLAAFYTVGYLQRESSRAHRDFEEGFAFRNEPEAVFTGLLLLFLSAMTFVTVCQHFGLLWVAIEATTLVSAPLIYFHRQHRSLEATWKYLLLCSVGIALSLLGNFVLAVAAIPTADAHDNEIPLLVSRLCEDAAKLDVMWLRTAFVLLLVGYGTKAGLAPMHNWKPDVYSEAPSAVTALFSGGLANLALLGILRAHQVLLAAGQEKFCSQLLILFGLVSLVVAAAFVIGQTDFKRMLAYSSVEHIGFIVLGVGIGGDGRFGALLHAVNHSITKAMMFFLAGNILAAFGTKNSREIQGLRSVLPATAALWLMGLLSITGSPPFGMFISELTILRAAFDRGMPLVAVVTMLLLLIIFVGMSITVWRMHFGEPGHIRPRPIRETWTMLGPPIVLACLMVLLGLYIPPFLKLTLQQAALSLGGV